MDKISLNFPELFIIGKYVKIGFKNWSCYAIFLVLEVKRSKTLQKLNIGDCFCLHSWFHFFMTFLAQKLIYTINFEQGNKLNLIILGVHAK